MMKKKHLCLVMLMLTTAISMGELVSYWDFEEGSGAVVADLSANSHTGTLMSNGASDPQWITGQVGDWALAFNAGTTGASNANYVIVDPNSASSDPNALGLKKLGDVFTISMWVRRDSDGVNPPLFSIYPPPVYTNAYDVQLAADPTWSNPITTRYTYWGWATAGDSSNRVQLADEQLAMPSIGTWYHLAITCDGISIKQYINGAEEASAAIPAESMANVVGNFFIGANDSGSAFFKGAIDDVAVWAGTYLPEEEVAKLADKSETPLTVVDVEPQPSLPPNYFVAKESDIVTSGWKTLWSPSFNWDVNIDFMNNTATAWWFDGTLSPGGRTTSWDPVKWFTKDISSGNYGHPAKDIDTYGIEWIHPSWSGEPNNIARFAAYITPGIALCQNSHGYQPYRPEVHSYENKDYFKTYARIAAVNGQGAQVCVKAYSYTEGDDYLDPNNLTLLDEVCWPLVSPDYEWQEFKHTFPKPTDGISTTKVWVEVGLVGGSEDTILYIDEYNPVSDQTVNYLTVDLDKDSVVYMNDLNLFSDEWLDSVDVIEPRDGGMLMNGDFFADLYALDSTATESKLDIDPAGWAFAGSGGPGESGVFLVQKPGVDTVGVMNYTNYVLTPLGGTVAAYTNEPNYVLEQTTVDTAVEDQTYYVMAYVMAKGWNSWKDFAIVSLEIDGVEVATFERALSRNRWRPVYGTYTATAADNGKPVTVKIAYDNRHTAESLNPEIMFIGYVYLGDTMPSEWPEGRDNLLGNGGFDEIDWLKETAFASVYDSLYNSDNWGRWFPELSTVPAPPSWLFEVPVGFNDPNEGGIWASGLFGTPLPTPGMNDVCIYASNDLILGQIVTYGLSSGTTYYLDMACGVNSSEYDTLSWPSPAPSMHLELWRIPVGIDDPETIHTGITTDQAGYTKIAEAFADATGNISGGGGAGVVASKWQMIGTTYTATATDTNVYIRVYGADGAASMPEFAFSDVYLSTEKRLVPGGDITFDIAGMPYDVAGPYTCYHASLMGAESMISDINGDCMVNLLDFVAIAEAWIYDFAF